MLGASLCCLQTFILQTSARGSITVWLTNPEKSSHTFIQRWIPSTCFPHHRSWARLTALLNKGLHEASPQIHIISLIYFQSSRWRTCLVAVLTCRNETHQRNWLFKHPRVYVHWTSHTGLYSAWFHTGSFRRVVLGSFPQFSSLTWSTQQETTCFRHDSELIL